MANKDKEIEEMKEDIKQNIKDEIGNVSAGGLVTMFEDVKKNKLTVGKFAREVADIVGDNVVNTVIQYFINK